MKNFKRIFVVLALVLALSFGVLTTAFANSESTEPETNGDGTAAPEVTPGETPEMDSILADRLAAIEAATPLKQYALPVIQGPLTWEDGTPELVGWKKSGTSVKTPWGEILSDVGVNDIRVEHEENGNAHFVVRYNGAAEKEYEAANGTIHSYPYISVSNRTQKNNLVIELDVTSFGKAYPAMGFEHSTVSTDAGGRAQPRMLEIKADGSISPSLVGKNCKSGYELTAEEKERFSQVKLGFNGEWTHISLIYESDTCFVTLYVDYEYIARWDTRPAGVSHYELSIFRYGTSNSDCLSSEVSIDNFIAYEGSYLRTPDLFEKMTEPEKFVFYSEYASSLDAPNADRVTAYKEASKLLEKYYEDGEFFPVVDTEMDADALAELNARLEEAVNGFNTFASEGYEALYLDYITDNLTMFGALVDEFLENQVRTLDNVENRATAFAQIEAFLNDCGADILTSEDSDYIDIKGRYDNISVAIGNDRSIIAFCNAVDKFYSATKFGADVMQRHYQNAADAYDLIIDRTVLNSEGFERFKECFELYESGAELLAQKIREKNSKTIVDCISFISGYTTVEQWEANYDYINRYIVIVRRVVSERVEDENGKLVINYDDTVAGVAEALEFFYTADEYFYGLLQREHAEYINAMLEKYLVATGYVEKVGICAHLRAYISTADISLEHELVEEAVIRLYIYESELEQYKDDYNDVLVQNTAIFKNTVNLMSTATGYAELLSLYNKAQELYFAMNVGDETIQNELKIFDEMTFRLESMEKASNDFLVAVELLRAETEEEGKYLALVNCYMYAANADTSYAGVAEAMEYYLAEYNAYNGVANAIISEIDALTGVAVASVRANCGVSEIVAVIVKKITGEN